MTHAEQRGLVRAIGRWSLAALITNSIIASGIFGLPSALANLLGPASVYGYLLAALGVGVIMACFAEVGSQFRQAGGPYLYAREAFGRFIGIQMGWLAWLVRLTSGAANANLFVIYLGEFWPAAGQPLPKLLTLALMIGLLTWVNYRGVSGGARMSNVFIVVKLVPLLLFIAVGLFYVGNVPGNEGTAPDTATWMEAILLMIFAYGGFEAGLMPMGEAKDPRRDAPFGLFAALLTCTVVYTLIQYVVVGILPNAATTDRPLSEAARYFWGSPGATLIALAAMFSVYGYMSSQLVNAPRLTYAFAEQGDFPGFFAAIHPRFRTPYVSILVYAGLVMLLAALGSFRWNAFLSAVARLFTYAFVCGSLIVFRIRRPQAEAFRLPGGILFAILGVLFALVLLSYMGWVELIIIVTTMAVALANWRWAARRRSSPREGGKDHSPGP